MNKIIKGMPLLMIIVTLSACKPIFGPNTSDNTNVPSDTNSSENVPSIDNSSTSDDITTSENESSSELTPSEPDNPNEDSLNEHGLANNPQDGVILHAFNWSLNNIRKYLPDIAKAGYSTIQTSPMQPQKDYYPNGNWKDQWWKLYQPLGFSIATKNNSLGTKSELISLCNEADKYGIKIIVDVVANHLANRNGKDIHPAIKEYEPEIYNQNLFHSFSNGETNDKTTKSVVQGHLGGLPDLKTESPIVQDRVYSLLKEYIDCGVDGFRFDAAKHIETPDDEEYASNFWPNTLGKAKSYYKDKTGDDLFAYAEILKTPGDTRKFSYYTKMMSLTDSEASFDIFDGLKRKDVSKVSKSDIYNDEIKAEHAILWGESHDTFSNNNGISKNSSQTMANKAYAIAASRNKASSLYFARPSGDSKVGDVKTFDWKGKAITEINKFHNTFINAKEFISGNDNLFLNVKTKGNQLGAVLVNLNDNNALNCPINGLADGIYFDQVSNSKVSVNNGKITGNIAKDGIAVLYKDNGPVVPFISVSHEGNDILTGPTKVTIVVKNVETSYYVIDDGERVYFKDSVEITIGEGMTSGEVRLKVVAINGDVRLTNTYEYLIMQINENEVVCMNVPLKEIQGKKVAAWCWKDSDPGFWVNGTLEGQTFRFELKNTANHVLLATFKPNDELDWKNKIRQTDDVAITKSKVINFENIAWK